MTSNADKPDHDGSYRTLFEQPVIVQHFLEAFAPPQIVSTLKFDLMAPIKTTFLAQNLARRYADCLWRIPTNTGGELFLCVLIEFQSSVDVFMAVRVATYTSLLYEHLINTERKALGQKLPPVLPIVLYNGADPWSANPEVANFIPVLAGSPLERLQLQMGYLPIDIARLSDTDKPPQPNLTSTLFEMELASNEAQPQHFDELFGRLLTLTEGHPARVALKRAFVIFFNGVLRHRGVLLDNETLDDLLEIRNMFFENLNDNLHKKFLQGKAEGKAEGRQEALFDVALGLLVSKFNASESTWRARLADLDEAHLNAFILRLVSATSLEELEEGHTH